jgi:hypothetical protein
MPSHAQLHGRKVHLTRPQGARLAQYRKEYHALIGGSVTYFTVTRRQKGTLQRKKIHKLRENQFADEH